jgi:diguanylate cyclase (GGDEF)-like protein
VKSQTEILSIDRIVTLLVPLCLNAAPQTAVVMTFDVFTLNFAGGLVSFASGLFLVIHWWQAREDRAALAWGTASCGAGVGITLLAMHAVLPEFASTVVGPLILDVCAAWTWAATRIFNRGSVERFPLAAAVAAWIVIVIVVGATGHDRLAAALGLGISGSLYVVAANEFWLARSEQLRGRWPMIFLLSLYAISIFLLAVEVCLLRPLLETPSTSWLGGIYFVGLIYASGTAISLVTMLKDRSETKHRAAALVDPLTGLANRRAFMDTAQRMFDRQAGDDAPISVLAFDLDRFKKINDTFGHPTGDHVLRIFAGLVSRTVRPSDIAGRMGGEEFALALPGCSADAALAIARRIRSSFQEEAYFVDGRPVGATVSVGVATVPEHGASLAEIIASSDIALYRAKDLGRNRVILAARDSAVPHHSITKIA